MGRGGAVRWVKVTSGDSVVVGSEPSVGGIRMVGYGERGGERGITYWVIVCEAKTEAEYLVEVKGIWVKDSDIHFPLVEVVGGDEADAWGKGLIDLGFQWSEREVSSR